MDTTKRDFEKLFRRSYGRILPGLIALTGDFGAAEDALQAAFAAAWKSWGQAAWPTNAEAWIQRVARRRGLDHLRQRRAGRSTALEPEHSYQDANSQGDLQMVAIAEGLDGEDDCLRLIFTACHPALAEDARVALTLNALLGLTAAEIGSAFLVSKVSMAQRLVRVKAKIKQAGIPFRVPPDHLLPERLPSVLSVLYLIFTTGHSPPSGAFALSVELCEEALRLTRLLLVRLPAEPELRGLLALMLLQHARAKGRSDAAGKLILLEHQDRSLWDMASIQEGHELLLSALAMGRAGNYQLQASIAALHSTAPSYAATDWQQILLLYGRLFELHPSPVVQLNRAVALAMVHGPAQGLELVEQLSRAGSLESYPYLHSTRAELLQRLGRHSDARVAWQRAMELAENRAQRQFLQGRLDALPSD